MIERYVDKFGLDLLPDFQRGHVWKREQQKLYVEFLLRGGSTNNVLYFNHPGWMNSFEGDFVVVDGLQRLTALMQFLLGEFPVFYGIFADALDLRGNWGVKFNINNLKTRKEVLTWYLEINENATPHTEEDILKVKTLLLKET